MTALQILGQISIYYVISNFKQHIFPLIATTRKVFTVLLSIFIFGHHVNLIQWISIIIVFIGAFL
jgi:UDP-galactose transporter B1